MAVVLLAQLISSGRSLAQGTDCSNPTEALTSANWSSIGPAYLQIETFFSTKIGYSGLNHVASKDERVKDRYLALLPGFVPSLVQVYPFGHALARVSNTMPVFYIHASEIGRLETNFDPESIHMLKLSVVADTRTLQVTRGLTAWTYKAAYAKAAEIAIQAERLSAEVISLRPLHPLPGGEYLITLDRDGNEGFEFGIDCR